MSKYKVGDKIYVKCKIVGISDEDDPIIELADWGNRIAVAGEEICTRTYEDGLDDAWAAAKMITAYVGDGGLSTKSLITIFGSSNRQSVMRDNTPQEAIAKIKAYEDSKEIRRGDEVILKDLPGIVIDSPVMDETPIVMWNNHKIGFADKDILTKTGRNFADKLDALLGEIGGEKQ